MVRFAEESLPSQAAPNPEDFRLNDDFLRRVLRVEGVENNSKVINL